MTFPAPSECTLVGSAAPLIHGNGGSSVPAGVGATVVFPGTDCRFAGGSPTPRPPSSGSSFHNQCALKQHCSRSNAADQLDPCFGLYQYLFCTQRTLLFPPVSLSLSLTHKHIILI